MTMNEIGNYIIRDINLRANERYRLSNQYYNATNQRLDLLDRESVQNFDNFYNERRIIGRTVFEELEQRGFNVMDRNCLELGHNIYDSIGINYDTRVIEENPRPLYRYDRGRHTPRGYKRFSYGTRDNDIHVTGYVDIGTHHEIIVPEELDISSISSYILLNPQSRHYEEIFTNMFNTGRENVFYGYYGNMNDQDRLEHLRSLRDLLSQNDTYMINIENENDYCYVLCRRHNRRR